MPRHLLSLLVALSIAAACGGSGESSGDHSAPNTTPAAAPSGASGKVTVVPHASLQALLPDLPGWTRGEPHGDTDTAESVSRVTVDYEKAPSTLSFEFMDSSMNDNMLASLRTMLAAAVPGPLGHTLTTISGFPAAEEWSPDFKNGTTHVLVANRFMVAVTGSGVPDAATIRKAVEAIDLQKMATLK